MTAADFDRCITLAQEKYRPYHPRLDYEATWNALSGMVGNPSFLLLCGRDVCFCAAAVTSFMEPLPTVGAIWIFTSKPNTREFLAVIRAMESWAADLGAVKVGFGNISDRDFTRVAERLGYSFVAQYFEKSLEPVK